MRPAAPAANGAGARAPAPAAAVATPPPVPVAAPALSLTVFHTNALLRSVTAAARGPEAPAVADLHGGVESLFRLLQRRARTKWTAARTCPLCSTSCRQPPPPCTTGAESSSQKADQGTAPVSSASVRKQRQRTRRIESNERTSVNQSRTRKSRRELTRDSDSSSAVGFCSLSVLCAAVVVCTAVAAIFPSRAVATRCCSPCRL